MLKRFFKRPFLPFRFWPIWQHVALAAFMVLLTTAWAHREWQQAAQQTQKVHSAFVQAQQQHQSLSANRAALGDVDDEDIAANWPNRSEIDGVIQAMGEAAQLHHITLRTVALSHSAATPQTWGHVLVETSFAGTYATVKAWQSTLLARFPSLAVQSLKMNGVNAHTQDTPFSDARGVEVQLTWIFHVRD
jgi:hypothetical protein